MRLDLGVVLGDRVGHAPLISVVHNLDANGLGGTGPLPLQPGVEGELRILTNLLPDSLTGGVRIAEEVPALGMVLWFAIDQGI
jgi:hypothetical protein